MRLMTGPWSDVLPARLGGQLVRFAAVGLVSTAAYVLLYAALRRYLAEVPSNTIALLCTAIANTAANRRLTFGVRGPQGVLRDHAGGLVVFGVAVVLTNAAVMGIHLTRRDPSIELEVAVLTAVNLIATAVRFVIFRTLLFDLRRERDRYLVVIERDPV
jgi:putative flippase GtrA